MKKERKQQNPDDIKQYLIKWTQKQEIRVLALYRKRQSQLENGKDVKDTDESIAALEKSISQRQARDQRKLLRIYEELEVAGNSREAKDARRQRTHRLCQLGGLVEKAGFGGMDPSALLGMLLQQKEYLDEHPNILNSWKERGQIVLTSENAPSVSIHSRLHPPTDSVLADRSQADCPLPEGRGFRP